MSYCVNCGQPYGDSGSVCPECLSDKHVLNEIVEKDLLAREGTSPMPHDVEFGFAGEKPALIFAVVITVVLAVIFGAMSFGLLILLLVVNLGYLAVVFQRDKRNMIRVNEKSFPQVCKLAKIAAYRLKLPVPPVYVSQDPEYNAYTMGFHRYGLIVLSSALVDELKPVELMFVIGHEMGHVKRYHTTWLNLLGPSSRTAEAHFFAAPVFRVIFNMWSVKAEYTADQAGLLACREPKSAVTTLLKLAGGRRVISEVVWESLLQSKEGEDEILDGILEFSGTHPFMQNRIRQIARFASSSRYLCAAVA